MERKKVMIQAEYIWTDGQAKRPQAGNHNKMAELRSKTKILEFSQDDLERRFNISALPEWGFDGSSTNQAEGNDSDCGLKPVFVCPDPIRKGNNILVYCEVTDPEGAPHNTNTRHQLAKLAEMHKDLGALFGIEQEYFMMSLGGKIPYAWEVLRKAWWSVGRFWKGLVGEPEAQGRYYCGVGADRMFGRPLVDRHMQACIDAGLKFSGINPEVAPGQAEFQIGPLPAPLVADQMEVARWLLHRLGEDYGIVVTLHPKPLGKKKDWNGSGAHTNFSTKGTMGTVEDGDAWETITDLCEELGYHHEDCIAVYGQDNDQRLTGKHETCSIRQFRCGVSDRGASIRIPMSTGKNQKGYIEDRRPASNMDPNEVCAALLRVAAGPCRCCGDPKDLCAEKKPPASV